MGMAAGQARLLSITSRMSDNELRAQLINNDKMRLATKSAQVSEAYVQALNDSQMMFTNYDADNNATYQQLTFNSLTAYNPYNNQYAISNSAGQVLVSERDADYFEKSNGDLNKFLGMYGLEQTTTYFDNLNEEYIFNNDDIDAAGNTIDRAGEVAYYTGNTTKDGKMELITTGYNAKELEAMYFGEKLTITDESGTVIGTEKYNGYFNTLQSDYYYNYSRDLASFNEKYDAYCKTLAQAMDEKLEGFKHTGTSMGEMTIEQTLDKIDALQDLLNDSDPSNDPDLTTGEEILGYVSAFINEAKKPEYTGSNAVANDYFNNLETTVSDAKNGEVTYTNITSDGSDSNIYLYDSTSNRLKIATDTVYNEETGKYEPVLDSHDNPVYNYEIAVGSSGVTLTVKNTEEYLDSSGNVDTSKPIGGTIGAKTVSNTKTIDGVEYYVFEIPANSTYETEACTIKIPKSVIEPMQGTPPTAPSSPTISETTELEVGSMLNAAQQVLESLQQSIYSVWDPEKFKPQNGDARWQAYTECKEAAEKLYDTIFGTNIHGDGDDTTTVDDEWFGILGDPDEMWDKVQANCGTDTDAYKNFKNIYEVITLDRVMNTFGEPKVAWIDTSSVTDSYNENGDAKAQWYTNLFQRMQDGGYKVLQDGLASSPEWIQFAFESGLVTLEQVDSKYAWNTVMYSNCSDITEQTNSEAITIAEAEYNAAMNKIENKDKMYDLELKNIDTEHNSLETEYESIKTAIDKNVERTFKIYS